MQGELAPEAGYAQCLHTPQAMIAHLVSRGAYDRKTERDCDRDRKSDQKGQRGHAHEANFGVKGVVWGVFIRWSRAFKVQKMGQIPEWDSVLI
jgi:hypothetical protein